MKEKLTDELKDIATQAKGWLGLEIEYAKLTVAEKGVVLMSSVALGAICLLLGVAALIMFAFALVEVFKLFLAPVFAYLSVGGLVLLMLIMIYIFRVDLVINPISRLVTRIFFDK